VKVKRPRFRRRPAGAVLAITKCATLSVNCPKSSVPMAKCSI
jgi:hypothetical protein